MTTIHQCEPELQRLKDMQKSLFQEESTNENLKKLKAIESQIARHERKAAEGKQATAVTEPQEAEPVEKAKPARQGKRSKATA